VCSTGVVHPRRRSRTRLAAQVAALIALGLASRWPPLPEFCILYVGDVLWGALFFTLATWLAPRATTLLLWVCATGTVEAIELSQLYQAPWAQEIRATALGGLLLGHSFSWSDVLCVALGTSAAALAVVPFPHRS
jgi:hypothetical protein